MNFPCPNVVTCPPGTEAENAALRNLSAELPDRFSYFGYYQCDPLGPNAPFSQCTSIVSQEQADFCAQACLPDTIFVNAEQTCSNDCASYTVPARQFLGVSQQNADAIAHSYACAALGVLCVASNAAQTCTETCADLSTQSYTMAAGRILAATQAIANNTAYQLACANAAALCLGAVVFNTAQSCSVICQATGGTVTYTVPAGLVAGITQADANSNAQALACTLGLLACPSLPPLVGNQEQTCSQDCNGVTIGYIVPAGAFVGLTQSDANSLAYVFCTMVLSGSCQSGQPPQQINVGSGPASCTIPCTGGGTFTATLAPGAFRGANYAIAQAAADSYVCSHAAEIQFCLDTIQSSICAGEVYASFVSTAVPGGVNSAVAPP